MFISSMDKARILDNIAFLIDEVQALKTKVAKLEGWKPEEKKLSSTKNIYKWAKDHSLDAPKTKSVVTFPVPKKRGRPVGSKNKVKK